MQIPEPIETYGYFWLIDEPNIRLSGLLRISENGDATLDIFGSFSPSIDALIQQPTGQSLRIMGVTSEAGAVTLVGCMVVEWNTVINIERLSKTRLHVGCVFWGEHFDVEDITLSGMTFSVEGLDEWFAFHHRPFSNNITQSNSVSFAYNQPDSISFEIPNQFLISFHMSHTGNASLFRLAITAKMSITLASTTPRVFSEYMETLQKLRNFLCLAFDRTVSFTSITGRWKKPDDSYSSVGIYSKFEPYDPLRETISAVNFLIPFEEISHNIRECIIRWLRNYEENEPTFNLYFAVTANRYIHLEGGFLFLVHGIESMHRRTSSDTRMPVEEFNNFIHSVLESTPSEWRQCVQEAFQHANELSLGSRIRKMISPFKELFGAKSARDEFVNKVVNTRNYLTHYDEGIKNKAVTDPQELLQLQSKLIALLQLHLLKILGIEHDKIKDMACKYLPLREKLGIH